MNKENIDIYIMKEGSGGRGGGYSKLKQRESNGAVIVLVFVSGAKDYLSSLYFSSFTLR